MAFVNEYVSEEDIKKYNLEEIWLEYNVIYRKTGVPSHVRLNWTVDHDRCIYLMWIGGAGYDQDFTDWVLYLNEKLINFRLTNPGGGSKNFKDQPYRIVWDLMSIHPELPELVKQETVQVLKEALTAYGYAGARNQAPGITIVEFKF